ncbi:MAG TPA: nitroreductase family protein [Dehalococcoidia bacterium]|nr:nitroreductase family protein [Dehalococcoidia bacterium]
MLTVWEAMKRRRSIRRFVPDDVPEDMVNQMLEAARLAPSGSNRQPWRFLVVRDRKIRKELSRICLGQRFIEEAPVVIVCFGDFERYSDAARKKRRQESVNSGAAGTASGRFADPEFIALMDSLPVPPREQLVTPVVANTYIAIEHLVLMATALGLSTCWVGAFEDPAEINRLFGLDDTLLPVAVIPVGYAAGEIPPPRPRLPLEEILVKPQIHAAGREK